MNLRKLSTHILAIAAIVLLSNSTLEAREVMKLNDDWRLFSASEGSGDRARNISLPFSWSLERNTPVRHTSVNFLRTLFIPNRWSERRIFLKFGAVATSADLFVNGRYVGEHRGGSTAFTFEITDKVTFGESNIVVLRVTSIPGNDILPTSTEIEQYGGICRDVELISTAQSAISPTFYGSDGLFVTTREIDGETILGEVTAHFVSPRAVDRGAQLTIRDNATGEVVLNQSIEKIVVDEAKPAVIPFTLVGAKLWSSDLPNLYDVTLTLNAPVANSEQGDEVSVRTGFRTIALAPDGSVKGALFINNESTLLRGVSLYHDHPTLGVELTPESFAADVATIQDLGANALRSAIVPHDRALYELCDERGVMVWIDTPLSRSPYLSDISYFPTDRFRENGMQQLREIIYQNYNHPSVVMWGLFSLLTTRGDAADGFIRQLNDEAHRIDITRPTVALSNQNGVMNTIPDLIVWKQKLGWDNGQFGDIGVWRDLIHKNWSHLRSGVLYGEEGSVGHQVDRSEIAVVRSRKRDAWFPEVRASAMHEAYAAELQSDSLMWGKWLNSLYDFKAPRSLLGENASGVVSFDRKSRKDSYFLYRALWNSDEPTLHIADKRARMLGMGDSLITMRVYSSNDSIAPIVTINGKQEREMRRIAPSQYVLDELSVRRRTNVVVTQGDMSDSVEFIYGSPLRTPER
ncbi:MAG: glycoside hydrolase family 2 TIM barrel-domain containing protein [Rikenellaceae bacterium]